MRLTFGSLVLVFLANVSFVGPVAAQQATPVVHLAFETDGKVSLDAQNVSVRDILREWARTCACYVVNADKLTGGPITVPMRFEHEDQGRVLESLLRQAAGYVLTARRPERIGASSFETIYILATSTASASGFTGSANPQIPVVPIATPGSPDDEIPPVAPLPSVAPRPTTPQAAPQAPPPGVFVPVPIVPIGPTTPSGPAPGSVTPVPRTP